ncbi:hypothetical protein ACSCBZ_46730 [Streptomyces niveiscabiei]|uniref:hypothetical protein n=1 Tax=Streptomyces niveiscabiei TaxID=164115 RepID=UPI003EBDF000
MRPVDLDHLVRAGLLTHADTAVSPTYKVVIKLYRQADLEHVQRLRRIDWHAVRATPPGRPSPLAQLPTHTASTTTRTTPSTRPSPSPAA